MTTFFGQFDAPGLAVLVGSLLLLGLFLWFIIDDRIADTRDRSADTYPDTRERRGPGDSPPHARPDGAGVHTPAPRTRRGPRAA